MRSINCICGNGQYIINQLVAVDENLSKKVVPRGNSQQLPEDTDFRIDEKTIDDAINFFESLIGEELNEEEREALEELFGILLARPIGENPTEETPLYDDYGDSNWEWDYEKKEYRNTETELIITEEIRDGLSIDFIDLYIIGLLASTTSMILGRTTIQTWYKSVTHNILLSTSGQYMFGNGGKNVLSTLSINKIQTIVQNNKTYFKKFGQEILAGELTGAQILQRIQMYGEAVTEGYERAKAHSYNVEMPEYPADGLQDCLSKCRCRWKFEEDPQDPRYVLGYWIVNPKAEHCKACLSNQSEWNPIRVKKGL